jgi:hypothetical protein
MSNIENNSGVAGSKVDLSDMMETNKCFIKRKDV